VLAIYIAGVTWSVWDVAADLSVFAGVLAGFVFLAIVPYADPSSRREHVHGPRLPIMVAAFFSFVVAAFLFALLHGASSKDSIDVFVEAICPSIVLAIGVVQLAVSLALGFEEGSAARRAADSVTFAAIAVAIVFLTGITVSPYFQSTVPSAALPSPFGHDVFSPNPIWLWLGSIILVALPLLPVLLGNRRRGRNRIWPYGIQRLVDSLVLEVHVPIGMAVIAAIAFNVLTGVGNDVGVYGTWMGQVLLALVLVAVGVPVAALVSQISGSATPGRHKPPRA
jgi:hypothetical protein